MISFATTPSSVIYNVLAYNDAVGEFVSSLLCIPIVTYCWHILLPQVFWP